jgi:hypothetical protein
MEPTPGGKKKKLVMIFLISLGLILVVAGLVLYFKFALKQNILIKTPLSFIFETSDIPQSTCSATEQIRYSYYAGNDPLWKENNKFGIYVYAEEKEFFSIADRLVNSNGGDWGYVLIPYNVNDYDYGKWGRVFNQLIGKHLIPVIQLYNVDVNDYKKETKRAAEFLNTFLWPIRYRYISVYNEPNDDNFWYGNANASEYAKILDYTIKTFKENNEDFYIMNGAFNISAGNTSSHIDAFEFMKKMNDSVPGIFDKLDGWASHPYPQPNFSGSPQATGRNSIRAYEDELAYLKSALNVKKDFPVFITETGWAHAEGENYNSSYLPDKTIAEYFKTAFTDVWLKDNRVRAVMPFTVIYDSPFDHFSWVNKDFVPYFHYDVIKSMKKVAGVPPKLETGGVTTPNCEF